MLKPRGGVCNLDCRYCYFLSKTKLYPDSAFRMTPELLEEHTRQYIESQPGPEVTFGWQGGEPTLMGLDFFRLAVELQRKHAKSGVRVRNALQTNGIALDDDWCRFFREHDFLIGISLDGPGALHDTYRRDKGGRATFDRVMAGLTLLKRHGVDFNILTTVNAVNAPHALEVYQFLRDQVCAQFIQLIPIVEPDGRAGVSPPSVAAQQYGEFLIAIFDEWVRRDVGRVFVQLFDVALAAWAGQRPGLCVFEETCGGGLVMEHNGDVYACDHFVDPTHRLGNISETPLVALATSEPQQRFGLAKREALPRYCRACHVRFVCNGGCPKDRIARAPDGEPGLNYLCAGYRAFFTHIGPAMRFMAAELQVQRPPANIMLYLARTEMELRGRFAHTGRNEVCPCGSGRKFKRCCGRSGGGAGRRKQSQR